MPLRSPLPEFWKVPDVLRARLGERAGRQRAMFAEGHLLLILHGVPQPDESRRTERFFWRKPDGTWESNHLGAGLKSLKKHLQQYTDALEKLDVAEEQACRSGDFLTILRDLAPLVRSARHMHAALQEARELVHDDRDVLVCRDRAYVTSRAAELLQSDTKNALDCAIVQRTEEQAEHAHQIAVASHRLNVLAATFLPVATIASVLGMNLAHGFEQTFSPWLFWSAVAGGVLLGLLIRSILFVEATPTSSSRPADRDRRSKNTRK